MGHIHRRPNRPGWYGYYKDASGRWRDVRLPGNKKEATEALRRLEHQAWLDRHSVGVPTDEVEIEKLREAWRAHILMHCRPRTWENYELGLDTVLGWLEQHAEQPRKFVRDLKLDDIRAFAAAKLSARASHRTVELRVGALRAMCNWAIQEGLIAHSPLARWKALKGPQRRERRSFSEFEIMKLLNASRQPYRDIWLMFLGTGLRAGELTALEWRDVDFDGKLLRVRAETSKSKRGREIPLREEVLTALRRTRSVASERPNAEAARRLVFVNALGNPWGRRLSRHFKRCVEVAGLSSDLDLHCLRHTFGSHLIKAGGDIKTVQGLLGHSSARVTLDIYAHEFDDRKREVIEMMVLPGVPEAEDRPAYVRPKAAAS